MKRLNIGDCIHICEIVTSIEINMLENVMTRLENL